MKRHSWPFVLLLTICGFPVSVVAQQQEIDFADPAGLLGVPGDCKKAAVCSGAPIEFANFYREKGMVFTDAVNPPDPALGPIRWGHYHLSYADPLIFLVQDPKTGIAPFKLFLSPFPLLLPLAHPESEKRVLRPHEPGAVVQMIYDPNNDGVPHPFNLISLEIYKGRINVGTKSPTTGISVYNNLVGPNKYRLIGANNLLRATIELPVKFGVEAEFTVDKIIFEPASSGARGLASSLPLTLPTQVEEGVVTPSPPSQIVNDVSESLLFELTGLSTPAIAFLHVRTADVDLAGPAQDHFLVRGSMRLAPESNGIDVSSEAVEVTLGAFRELIPAGSFSCKPGNHNDSETMCHFKGSPGGIIFMGITTTSGQIEFEVKATDLNLTGIDLSKPLPFSLQIKDDLGVTHISPEKLEADF
jgi:hypothetical protein